MVVRIGKTGKGNKKYPDRVVREGKTGKGNNKYPDR
jgi:hypothetical protein